MSNRERRRELIFGILYTLFGVLLLGVGMAVEKSESMLIGFVFLIIGGFSWIKLAIHSPSKPQKSRPIKQNAAHMARERELEELKARQAAAHQNRKQAYLANPVPLQMRQWIASRQWDWDYNRHLLTQRLYIYQVGQTSLGVGRVSMSYRDCCQIYRKEDGIWYLRPTAHNVQVRMNIQSVRDKCAGMPVNTQEFGVPRDVEQELLPGDCFAVIAGSIVGYFRIDQIG